MDYVSMKMSIYENYANGKLTQENARQLIDVLNNNYGNTLVQEMVNAENEFMMNSVNVAYESAGVDALYEASETFGQKVAKIWENFKKWIKGIIDAILGRKKEVPDKSKVTVKKGLPKAMDDLLTQVKKLKSAKGAAAIGAAVTAVIGATAVVKKLKGKPSKGDATEETDATVLAKKAEDVAKNAADAPKVETPTPAVQGQSSEQKTDPKVGEEQVTPSKVISSVTGAATVADDVSRQAVASSPEHTESSTNSQTANVSDLGQLLDKFKKDSGLDGVRDKVLFIENLANDGLHNYAKVDPEDGTEYIEYEPHRHLQKTQRTGRKTFEEIFKGYISNCGVVHKKRIRDYCDEYHTILDNEYPDTPEGNEKLRSDLVSCSGKVASIVKNFETTYNRVNPPSRERNLEKLKYIKKEDWSAQAANTVAGFYLNCQDFRYRIDGFRYALREKCEKKYIISRK